MGKVPKVTAFMKEGKCHWRRVLPSHVPAACRKGERAGGQHISGEGGISLGPARGGPKPRPCLNIPAFLILLFLYFLIFRERKIFASRIGSVNPRVSPSPCPGVVLLSVVLPSLFPTMPQTLCLQQHLLFFSAGS